MIRLIQEHIGLFKLRHHIIFLKYLIFPCILLHLYGCQCYYLVSLLLTSIMSLCLCHLLIECGSQLLPLVLVILNTFTILTRHRGYRTWLWFQFIHHFIWAKISWVWTICIIKILNLEVELFLELWLIISVDFDLDNMVINSGGLGLHGTDPRHGLVFIVPHRGEFPGVFRGGSCSGDELFGSGITW